MKIAFVAAVIALLLLIGVVIILRMRRGPRAVPPPSAAQHTLRDRLHRDVNALCANGPRNTFARENLAAAADFIERSLAPLKVERQQFFVEEDQVHVANLIAEVRGVSHPEEIIVVGAHYDSIDDTTGADDNASGVAGLLAIARRLADTRPARTIRFVAFVNEEPPHFKTQTMGSWQYAKRCRERNEHIVAMFSLEMLGYYDAARGSQQYPPLLAPFFPDTGDFIAFAGNLGSRASIHDSVRAFRAHSTFPIESASLPELVEQVGWSDQWSFWQFDYPGVMVTDTALFRNPHYHTRDDQPDTLDYDRMAHVVDGLTEMIRALADH